jgi:predicted ATPase
MAKFRDSTPEADVVEAHAAVDSAAAGAGEAAVHDRSIGDILAELRHLTAAQVEKVL